MNERADSNGEKVRPVLITYPTIYSLLIVNFLVYRCGIKLSGIVLSSSHIKRKGRMFSLLHSFFILRKRSGTAYALYMLLVIKGTWPIRLLLNAVSRLKGKGLKIKTFGQIAREKKIPVMQSLNINNRETLGFMKKNSANLLLSIYNNQIIRYRIAKLFTYKGINVHNSLLPDFGGLDAAFENLYRKVNESGATAHYIDYTIDTGDIIEQAKFDIDAEDTVFSLNLRQWISGAALIPGILSRLKEGTVTARRQDLSRMKHPYRSFPGRQRVKVLLSRRDRSLVSFPDILGLRPYLYRLFEKGDGRE